MIRRLLAALAGLTLILTLAAPAAATPVRADDEAAALASCGVVGVCLWDNSDYGGQVEYIFTRPAGSCVNLQALRNRVTSFINRSGRTIRMYFNQGCGGGYIQRPNGGSTSNMRISVPFHGNDNGESIRFEL